jgi:hypothetical protein
MTRRSQPDGWVDPPDRPRNGRPTAAAKVGRFFRSPATGDVVVAQPPNLPLTVFLVVTVLRLALHPHGTAATVLHVVGTGALSWWAVLEVARGESPFRRVLGAGVLLAVVVGLLAAH